LGQDTQWRFIKLAGLSGDAQPAGLRLGQNNRLLRRSATLSFLAFAMLFLRSVETLPNFIPGNLVSLTVFVIMAEANDPASYPHALRSRVRRFFNL
jgi:hypothetical protein